MLGITKKEPKSAVTIFQEYKEAIDPILKAYLEKRIIEAEKISSHCGELVRYITELTLRGGKRVRPAILYYSYLAHGGKKKEAIRHASMALELAQTFILAHDDIMDNDPLRRGGKTLHKIYEEMAREKFPKMANPEHFGHSIALLAGDFANGLSNEILAELSQFGINPIYVNKALLELNKMYGQEYYGQLMDVMSGLIEGFKQEDLIKVHRYKTVPYTIDSPLKIGAILAGANEKQLEKLEKYSVPLGIAFQIQDDVLGMFGTEEKLGKPVTSDLKEGKKTLLILDTLEVCNPKDRELILQKLGNKGVDYKDVESVRNIIKESGSLDKSSELASKYVAQATQAIQEIKLKKEGKEFLIGIADYMVKREY